MSRRLALGALAALIVACSAIVMRGTRDDPYAVRVVFDNAAGLREDSRVQIGGQPAGTVAGLELDRADRAVATLELAPDAAPVGAGARAIVRPANLLGEKYVEIKRGDFRERPQPSGATIPPSRTQLPVELDDVLDVLDSPTRRALHALINESGIALTGRGGDFTRTLMAMPSSFDRTGELVRGFADDNRALGRLLEESDRVVGSIAQERAALGRLVGSATSVMSTTSARHQDLAATVRTTPGAVRQLRESLARLQGTAVALGPAADALRRASPSLERLLDSVPAFTRDARPTLRSARATAPALSRLGQEATPVVSRLRPLASELKGFGRSLSRFSGVLERVTPDTLAVAEGWARAIQARDGASHLFRNDLGVTNESLTSLIDQLSRRVPAQARSQEPDDERQSAIDYLLGS